MKLTSTQGEFELTILDYEYSDSPHFMERNWLLVNLTTRVGGHEHQQMAPLLSTWELELLRDWMSAVAGDGATSPKLTFVEPALAFRADSIGKGDYRFQIKLTPDATQTNRAEPHWLTVATDHQQVQLAISELDDHLSRFPVRN